jgi:hypothetical protein
LASRRTSARSSAATAGRPRRWGVGPATPDQVAMPPQQRCRLHEHPTPGPAGQQPHQPSQHRPVCPVHARLGHLASQHRDLLPQHEQLDILGRRTPRQQRKPPQHLAEQQIKQSQDQTPIIAADGFFDELAAQPSRPTSWHPQVRIPRGASLSPQLSGPAAGRRPLSGHRNTTSLRPRRRVVPTRLRPPATTSANPPFLLVTAAPRRSTRPRIAGTASSSGNSLVTSLRLPLVRMTSSN